MTSSGGGRVVKEEFVNVTGDDEEEEDEGEGLFARVSSVDHMLACTDDSDAHVTVTHSGIGVVSSNQFQEVVVEEGAEFMDESTILEGPTRNEDDASRQLAALQTFAQLCKQMNEPAGETADYELTAECSQPNVNSDQTGSDSRLRPRKARINYNPKHARDNDTESEGGHKFRAPVADYLERLSANRFRCNICKKSLYGYTYEEKRHVQAHSSMKLSIQCPFCQRQFIGQRMRAALKDHVVNLHGQAMQATPIDLEQLEPKWLKCKPSVLPMKRGPRSKPPPGGLAYNVFECRCGMSFRTSDQLEEHITLDCASAVKFSDVLQCPYCNQQVDATEFRYETHIEEHVRSLENE